MDGETESQAMDFHRLWLKIRELGLVLEHPHYQPRVVFRTSLPGWII